MAAHRDGRMDGRTLSQRLEGSDWELEMTRKEKEEKEEKEEERSEMGSIEGGGRSRERVRGKQLNHFESRPTLLHSYRLL